MCFRLLASAAVATMMLTACYNAGQTNPEASTQAQKINQARIEGPPGLYVTTCVVPSECNTSALVDIYKIGNQYKNDKPSCSLGDYTGGTTLGNLSIDHQGHVWVPEGVAPTYRYPGSGSITEFGKRCKRSGYHVIKTLNDPAGQPIAEAFDSSNNVYVANNQYLVGGNGNVAIYPPGATYPSTVLSLPSRCSTCLVNGIAVDANDDVFVSVDFDGGSIIEYPEGSTNGVTLDINGLGPPNGWASGLAFDRQQNLIVADPKLPALLIYTPPYSGAPAREVGVQLNPYGSFTLNASNTRIYVAGSSAIWVYNYESGRHIYTITESTSAIGIAVDPPAPN